MCMPRRPLLARSLAWLPAWVLLCASLAGAVTNTGRAALDFAACNGRVGFPEPEAQQGGGGTDLNGDGDATDAVLQILTLSNGAITNVGRDASGVLACGGDLFAFGVIEFNQNDTDLDGDGDTFDRVLNVYDAATHATTNVGLPVAAVVVSDSASQALIGFTVPESVLGPGGTDLNGDGDTTDVVLHVYDPATHVTTNLGLAASTDLKIFEKTIAFRVSEAEQGQDLNGDGDLLDSVLFVYDGATATTINTHMAADPSILLDGHVVAFRVNEIAQGNVSRNGDPDVGDDVMTLYCLAPSPCTATGVINLALAADPGFDLKGDLLSFAIREKGQGGVSLNPPDTDGADTVVQVYRISTGVRTNLGLPGNLERIAGDKVAFGVYERQQAHTDLNGDFDRVDHVMHVYDASTGIVTNLGRALQRSCPKVAGQPNKGACFSADGDILAFAVNEKGQNRTDLNADTDRNDDVVEMYRLSTGTRVSTARSTWKHSALVTKGTLGAFRSYEKDERVSLNGDLDRADKIIGMMDTSTLTSSLLGYAAESHFAIESGHVIWRTSEAEQAATDLNGDGDAFDTVLFYQ